ncbi:hypothetical protein OS493_013636 [Desmophyllum pertusum]|uniref:Uncharacterized protein n=1 Tax=Desmophyllum pertusum TaxID=174260 RepID=A0A9X0A2I3_9CNID|nr:hypothetical protein OS493_013636 [Desmophyllum pertusum]
MQSAKAVLNDADLIEIFGSSDEEDDGKSSFMLKQTKLKDGTHDSRLCGFESRNNIPEDVFDTLDTEYPQGPMQHANKGTFSSNNDLKNAASEEHCSESINSSKGCRLSSVLQDVSCASSSNIGVKCVNGATAKKKEPPRGTRKVLKPANTSQHRTSQSSMQCVKGESHPTVQYDCVNGISPYGRSEKLEEHESWKKMLTLHLTMTCLLHCLNDLESSSVQNKGWPVSIPFRLYQMTSEVLVQTQNSF